MLQLYKAHMNYNNVHIKYLQLFIWKPDMNGAHKIWNIIIMACVFEAGVFYQSY